MAAFEVALQIAGSVALLLFGLTLIRAGMEEAFGLRLKLVIGFGTQTGLRAFLAGLAATLGLQSSTATALLTASFVERKLIGARMAQIVLLGANLGTALTALIVSTGIEAAGPVLVLIGYALRRRKGQVMIGAGNALIGIGLMLISLMLLEHATLPIRDSAALAAFLAMLDTAMPVALLMAAGLAVLCSSSLAAVLLVSSLPMSPELTVVMVLGANLGGAVPAVIATSAGQGGAHGAAQHLTVGNLIIRAIGCLLALPLAGVLAGAISGLPVERLGLETGLAVEAHLAFNLVLAALIWPFVGMIGRLVAKLLPVDEPVLAEGEGFLDETLLETPLMALSGAKREALAIGDLCERMLEQTREAFASGDTSHMAAVAELEDRVDRRQHGVKTYLSRLGSTASEEDRRRAITILDYVINLEHIGDIIDRGLGPAVRKKVGLGLRFSDEGYRELDRMFMMSRENLRMAQTVFMTLDREVARKLVESKVDIRNFERQSAQRHLIRLRNGGADSHETSSLHLDILRDLKRVNAHAVSVAHPILDEEGLLVESRLRRHKAEHKLEKKKHKLVKAAEAGTE
jgi:phosphate:Na+ symporter